MEKKTDTLPEGAHSLEVFHIDEKNKEAYIGYKLPNNDFHFIQVPLTVIS